MEINLLDFLTELSDHKAEMISGGAGCATTKGIEKRKSTFPKQPQPSPPTTGVCGVNMSCPEVDSGGGICGVNMSC